MQNYPFNFQNPSDMYVEAIFQKYLKLPWDVGDVCFIGKRPVMRHPDFTDPQIKLAALVRRWPQQGHHSNMATVDEHGGTVKPWTAAAHSWKRNKKRDKSVGWCWGKTK